MRLEVEARAVLSRVEAGRNAAVGVVLPATLAAWHTVCPVAPKASSRKLKSPHRGHFQLSERAFAAEEDDDAQEDAG
jgi:hypothetical protein